MHSVLVHYAYLHPARTGFIRVAADCLSECVYLSPGLGEGHGGREGDAVGVGEGHGRGRG